jgi:lysophospholipase L1-like esterase
MTDEGWQDRAELLAPQLWLVHLGVNDERAHVSPDQMITNLERLANLLIEKYSTQPRHIILAKPSYDYWPQAPDYLKAYCYQIDKLIKKLNISPGPDFFAAFATDREKWYGRDPVHPGPEGMRYMARLWHESIINSKIG